ncbi:hypothetical protein QP176_00380 [Sphingomonas aerolata]
MTLANRREVRQRRTLIESLLVKFTRAALLPPLGRPPQVAPPWAAALSSFITVPLQQGDGLVTVNIVTPHDPSHGIATAVAGKAIPNPARDIETVCGIGVKRTRTTLPVAVRIEWPQRRRGGDEVGKQTSTDRCERPLHDIALSQSFDAHPGRLSQYWPLCPCGGRPQLRKPGISDDEGRHAAPVTGIVKPKDARRRELTAFEA